MSDHNKIRGVGASPARVPTTKTMAAVQGKLVKPVVATATASLWDYCFLESETLAQIKLLSNSVATGSAISSSGSNGAFDESKQGDVGFDSLLKEYDESLAWSTTGSALSLSKRNAKGSSSSSIANVPIVDLQQAINSTETACRESIEVMDGILGILSDVNDSYTDVTSRTNSLMTNCEHLLEQQHTYQQTVQILNATLEPFNDIEEISKLLGIPFEAFPGARNSADTTAATNNNSNSVCDPRSPEFKDVLERLAKAANFLQSQQEILDKQRYLLWLENLENRAMSLVGRAMRELIEKAAKTCADLYQQQIYEQAIAVSKSNRSSNNSISNNNNNNNNSSGSGGGSGGGMMDDRPIESAPVYQKFRGLGYRLRELGSLLATGSFAESVQLHLRSHFPYSSTDTAVAGGGKRSSHRSHNNSSSNLNSSVSNRAINRRIAHSNGSSDAATAVVVEVPVIAEVKEGYVAVRSDLLLPFIKDTWAAGLAAAGISLTVDHSKTAVAAAGGYRTAANSAASLCSGIRSAFATLLRVTQLEQQLFDSLFINTTADSSNNSSTASTPTAAASAALRRSSSLDSSSFNATTTAAGRQQQQQSEVLSVVRTLSNAARDFLRPYIIRESNVDELCRVVSALSEDVRSQMLSMPVPALILKQLLRGLDGTVNDAKERLSYCAEMHLRTTVQLFEPLPSQLSYPDILEAFALHQSSTATATSVDAVAASGDLVITDVYQTWYPPMRSSLSLLSKLYGVVEMAVFEDFARRAVRLCVLSLRAGAEGVKRSHSPGIHGDLFLVRHLLILREQLVPFELRLQGVEKHLDFSTTGSALQQLLSNAQTMWRFDESNGFLELARSGVPRMQETQIDVKRDLDGALKAACFALKLSAVKMLLGAIDGFLAKVTAFVGNIPTSMEAAAASAATATGDAATTGTASADTAATTTIPMAAAGDAASRVPLLPPQMRSRLKSQAFVRPERVKEMLESVQSVLLQRVPDLKAVMELYIENSVARTILLKPILQDFEESKRKMDCIIASCLDPGQARRDVELLLQTLAMTVISELTNG